jgi:hypothetical protein
MATLWRLAVAGKVLETFSLIVPLFLAALMLNAPLTDLDL